MRVRLLLTIMPKRARSSTINSRSAPTKVELSTSSQNDGTPTKKTRQDTKFLPNKIATAENAAKVDAHPPLLTLLDAVRDHGTNADVAKGDCVVYWMRMEDLRSACLCRLSTGKLDSRQGQYATTGPLLKRQPKRSEMVCLWLCCTS